MKLKIQNIFLRLCIGLFLMIAFSCTKKGANQSEKFEKIKKNDSIIIDCNYTFDEAIADTRAPQYIVDQLELFSVHYYAFDGKIHRGQLLANKLIVNDLREVFKDILQMRFPIAKVIPIVKYNWDDEQSMNDNNTYCFCYRNADYSKHAYGLAIDINPMQNPNRWKPEFSYRTDKPIAARYNPTVPGTFTPNHTIVLLFAEKGFLWGRYFKRNNDDHHFEKK